jgi:hypothetical protein
MRVKVRSVKDSFRRAGMAFTERPREIEVDKKTLAVLQAESMLVVEVLPEEKPKLDEEGGAASETGGKPSGKKEPGKGK